MPFANQPESAVLGRAETYNEEDLWGHDEAEWAHWRTAKRYMKLDDYNEAQMKEMTSERSRKAYEMIMGTSVTPPSDDMVAMCYANHGGSKYFKRRNWQYIRDPKITERDIFDYYEKRKWEKETNEHI